MPAPSIPALLAMGISVLALMASSARSSPFALTEEYMKRYQTGMSELERAAHEYRAKEFSYNELFKDKQVVKDPHEHDFIVVGGGTSGAVLAARLSEVPEHRVLLLDAGYLESPITMIPGMHAATARAHQWGYRSTPQSTWCLGEAQRQCPVPTARLLGGTTALNEMVYNRGNRRDFDAWADEENRAWCYDDVLPYFKRAEDAYLAHPDRRYHLQGGRQSVEDNSRDPGTHNLTRRFVAAGHELAYAEMDYNGKEQLGFAGLQLMTLRGERRSAFAAHLANLRRKNLDVVAGAVAVQVLVAPHTKQAHGVKYIDRQGNVKVAQATKEVILAAGAVNSAQLLMVSGVGPASHLKEVGVECLVDLPVGDHLLDHPAVDLDFDDHHDHHEKSDAVDHHARVNRESHEVEEEPIDDDLLDYLKNHRGPLTQPQSKGLAYVKTPSSRRSAKDPDVLLTLRRPHPADHHLVSISVALTHPLSAGSVRLLASDPLRHPAVHLPFYTDRDEVDLKTMLEGMAIARKVAHLMGLKEVADARCSRQGKDKDKDDDVDVCLIRHRTRALGDLTGTARMGKDPHSAVVDEELRVHGVERLRVVDLAVVPVSISGDVRAAGMMIAEKGADLIKAKWQ